MITIGYRCFHDIYVMFSNMGDHILYGSLCIIPDLAQLQIIGYFSADYSPLGCEIINPRWPPDYDVGKCNLAHRCGFGVRYFVHKRR